MKRYLAVFTGDPATMAAWMQLPEAERRQRELAGMKGWHDWAERHRKSIVEMGGPLSRTKRITKTGVADVRNTMGGFTIVQADSQDAAAALFLNHPHFSLFPGDGVDVMEILPVPPKPGA